MPDKIGLAIIGAGRWGSNLIRVFNSNPRCEIIAIVDIRTERRDALAERYPDLAFTDDLSSVLDNDRVQAIVVATPGPTHYNVARQSLLAGKHTFVEKPLTTEISTARELCELAEKMSLVLMVGHVFVHNPSVQRVRQLIASGQMGEILHISSLRTNLGPFLDEINAAWDLACHDVSIANFWLDSSPVSVRATGGSWIHQPTEEIVFAMLRYPSNVLVSMHVSWLSPLKRRETTVVGDQAMLIFDDVNLMEPIRIFNTGVPPTESNEDLDSYVSFRTSVRSGDILIPKVDSREPLTVESDAFLDAIQTGVATNSDGRHGLQVVQVLSAIEESLRQSDQEIQIRQE